MSFSPLDLNWCSNWYLLRVRLPSSVFAGKSNQDVRWAHNPEVRVQIPLPLFHMFISFSIHKKKQFICFFQTVDKMVPGAMHPEPF